MKMNLPEAAGFATAVWLALAPAPATAQQWSVDLYAGNAKHEAVSGDITTVNAVADVQYDGIENSFFYLAGAAPLQSGDTYWGAAGAGGRLGTRGGRASFGLDLGGDGYLYRDPDSAATGTGATLLAMPVLALTSGIARLELRSGVQYHVASFVGFTYERTLHDSDLTGVVRVAPGMDLGGQFRYARAKEGNYPYAGATAAYTGQRLEVWGYVGHWLDDLVPGTTWGASAQIDIGSRFAIWGSAQHEVSEPLYWNPPRTTWNVGLRRTFGPRPIVLAPAPSPLARVADGSVTFTLPEREAHGGQPAVAGDFNGWDAVPMRLVGGIWTVTLPIGRGTYHYAFRAADGSWFLPPYATAVVKDDFGGYSALLIVN